MVQPNPPVSSGEFDSDFQRDDRLFHYTSSEGLYGILESGCFWATHFRFLNDNNEFFAAKKSLRSFVECEVRKKIAALKVSGIISLKDGVTIKGLSEHEANTVVEAMYTTTLNLSAPFVFSTFVSNQNSKDFQNGRLLHWATYGRNGGYAIQINPHKLAQLIWGRKDNLLSQKVVYVGEMVPPELSSEYDAIGKLAQEMIEAILHERLEQVDVTKGGQAFMSVASRIKDAFFEEEQEARIVLLRLKEPVGGYVPPEVFMRHTKGGAVPYVKLFEGRLLADTNPIEAIVTGPHSDRERRVEALSLYLEAKGLKEISVVQSNVPYLGT